METDPHHNLDEHLDHDVDTRPSNYAEAWERSGVEPPDNADFTAAAISARSESLGLTDDIEVLAAEDLEPMDGNQKGGPDRARWGKLTDEQRQKNNAGIAAVRAAIKRS
jgi:hypothetical protein